MARLGVTYQDIANAAEQIVGEGRQPTIELIRHLLGTGSSTTIANHLRQWRAEQDGSTSVAIKENLPQEFVAMMKGLWQRLQAHADNQIEIVKQASSSQILGLNQEVEKYKINNQRWQKLHNAWVQEKEALSRDKLGMDQAILMLQKDNAALVTKLEVQQNQLLEKQQRIDELNRLHRLAQENLEHYRESARIQRLMDQEKQAQQLQQIEMSLKSTEQQLQTITQDKTILQSQLNKTLHEKDNLQNIADAASHKYAALQSNFTALENQNNEMKHAFKHHQHQHEIFQKRCEDLNLSLIEQQKQNAILSQQLSVAVDEIKDLKDQSKFLAREKWEIAQEKAQLEGQMKQMEKMISA